jgi:hypothetical protein
MQARFKSGYGVMIFDRDIPLELRKKRKFFGFLSQTFAGMYVHV